MERYEREKERENKWPLSRKRKKLSEIPCVTYIVNSRNDPFLQPRLDVAPLFVLRYRRAFCLFARSPLHAVCLTVCQIENR